MANGVEDIAVFVIAHRKDLEDLLLSYGGVLMRIMLDYDKWTFKTLCAYVAVSITLVAITATYLVRYGVNAELGFFVLLTVGFCGQTIVKYFLEDFLLDVMKAIKNRVLDKIKGQQDPKK